MDRIVNVLKYDVLVVGAGTAAIAAALDLKEAGYEVLVATHRNYLGEDICDSLRLALPDGFAARSPLAKRLYGEAVESGSILRPMHLKRTLDQVLMEKDIPVVCSHYVSALFLDASGIPGELELDSGNGKVRVAFRLLVDGSLRGELGRFAGVAMSAPESGFPIWRHVLGGTARDASLNWVQEGELEETVEGKKQLIPFWTCRQNASLADGSWEAWMALEQANRIDAYRRGQMQSADSLFALTGERLHPELEVPEGTTEIEDITTAQCSAMNGRLWFTGPVLNVPAALRSALVRHDWALDLGAHLGRLMAAGLPGMAFAEAPARPLSRASGTCAVDVLVVGGGTGGAPAAIGAARKGAKTLVCEYLSGLGGVGTLGMIGRYWFGNRVGFTSEVDAGAASLTDRVIEDGWDIEAKMQWYHEQVSSAEGTIWYKTGVSGAVMDEAGSLTGVDLLTPQGPVRVSAKAFVDATGSAALAAAAGAPTATMGERHLALQGAGLPARRLGLDYNNTDYEFIDETSSEDVATSHLTAREKFKEAFDAGQLVDSRERRRIVGEYEVTPMDIRLKRTFPDTIVKARSNFDTHGFTVHPLFFIVLPDHEPMEAYVPLRALMPKGISNLLVTGLGISAHRDAMPVIRMQADVQNQGYAAGYLAAFMVSQGLGDFRRVDVGQAQEHLAEVGILGPEMVRPEDSFPLPRAEVQRALDRSPTDPDLIDRVFTLSREERIRCLREHYGKAPDLAAKRHFAFVLAVLGDSTGLETLIEEVTSSPWDKGWDYTGMGQFGASMSALDTRIMALGMARSDAAIPCLLDKAQALPDLAAFSHYRALADVFMRLRPAGAVPLLEAFLERQGLTGNHLHSARDRMKTAAGSAIETSYRNAALIELHLAAALFAIEPSHQLARRILEAFARDVRGLFARFARNQLARSSSG